MPNVTIENDITVYVYCESCGAHLCNQSEVRGSNGHIDVYVECCQECLKSQKEEYEARIAELEKELERIKEGANNEYL